MKKIIAIIGDAKIEADGEKYKLAYDLGESLINAGYRIQCGGMGGVMEAACRGAKAAEKHTDGDIIAVLPGFDPTSGNMYADIYIPTGLDFYRNNIVAGASAVIAIGGGSGTLSEIAAAWALKRLCIGYENVSGWSSKLAGKKIDNKVRYKSIPADKVFAVKNSAQVLAVLSEYVDKYNKYHTGIKY